MITPIHNILLWFLAAILVVAAAGPFPQAATLFVGILIFFALLRIAGTSPYNQSIGG